MTAGNGRTTVLLEMRPALDGHAGIPQETRLLFRGLRRLPGIEPIGLIQHHGMVLSRGLPPDERKRHRLPVHKRLNRLSRVVISLEQRLGNPYIAAAKLAVRQSLGATERLDHFDATYFRDFVWRSMFGRTLHADDFESVTSAQFRTVQVPWKSMHFAAMAARQIGLPMYPRLDTSGIDMMIAETPYPGRVVNGTKLVVRYHDAIPVLMPHTISDKSRHQARHYRALQRNVSDGAWFACVSESTRQDLLSIFPEAEARAVTIPNMISTHYFHEESSPDLVPEILRNRKSTSIGNSPRDEAERSTIALPADGFDHRAPQEPRHAAFRLGTPAGVRRIGPQTRARGRARLELQEDRKKVPAMDRAGCVMAARRRAFQ